MKPPQRRLEACRRAMGAFYDFWEGRPVKLFGPGRTRWLIQCGEGRFEPAKENAAFAKRTHIGLNYQITGENEAVRSFEFCVAWASGWRLMFHYDPDREAWPDHPGFHVQLDCPPEAQEAPPFCDWRIPLGETDPTRILEYVVGRIR